MGRVVADRFWVYITARPSVCPIDRQQQRQPACLLLSAMPAEDTDRQLQARCRRRTAGAPALSSKCGQRHVDSRRRRLNTDFRQITTSTPHHSIFTGRMLFMTPNQHCQSTEGTPWPIVKYREYPACARHGTGSFCHRVNGLFGSSFTSGSPGHLVIILTRCETRVFPVF